MYFNVSQLMREPSGSQRAFNVRERVALMDRPEPGTVLGQVRMLKTDKGIWVSAHLETKVASTCSRCLKEYDQPIHLAIEEEFFPVVDTATGARVEPSGEGQGNSCIDEDHILDLSEPVRQYAEVSLPMKPLCRAECAGLCPTCGADLNEDECRCRRAPQDSRWAKLLELAPTRTTNGVSGASTT